MKTTTDLFAREKESHEHKRRKSKWNQIAWCIRENQLVYLMIWTRMKNSFMLHCSSIID